MWITSINLLYFWNNAGNSWKSQENRKSSSAVLVKVNLYYFMNLLGTKRANKYFVSFDPKSNFLISLISAKRFCSTFVIERYPYVVEIVMHKRYQFLPVFEVTSTIRDSKISQNSKHIFSVSHWKSRNYPSHTVKTTEGSGLDSPHSRMQIFPDLRM